MFWKSVCSSSSQFWFTWNSGTFPVLLRQLGLWFWSWLLKNETIFETVLWSLSPGLRWSSHSCQWEKTAGYFCLGLFNPFMAFCLWSSLVNSTCLLSTCAKALLGAFVLSLTYMTWAPALQKTQKSWLHDLWIFYFYLLMLMIHSPFVLAQIVHGTFAHCSADWSDLQIRSRLITCHDCLWEIFTLETLLVSRQSKQKFRDLGFWAICQLNQLTSRFQPRFIVSYFYPSDIFFYLKTQASDCNQHCMSFITLITLTQILFQSR